MHSPLRPRVGYSVTVSQLEGGRPIVAASCNTCVDWSHSTAIDTLDDDAASAATILVAVKLAAGHVASHISERVTL